MSALAAAVRYNNSLPDQGVSVPSSPINTARERLLPIAQPSTGPTQAAVQGMVQSAAGTIIGTIDSYGGGTYVGDLSREGLPHGKGKLTKPNHESYDGYWRNGEKHGEGTEQIPLNPHDEDPSVFQTSMGNWEWDKKHGEFKVVCLGSVTYESYDQGLRQECCCTTEDCCTIL
jgi:hypothetical protein